MFVDLYYYFFLGGKEIEEKVEKKKLAQKTKREEIVRVHTWEEQMTSKFSPSAFCALSSFCSLQWCTYVRTTYDIYVL